MTSKAPAALHEPGLTPRERVGLALHRGTDHRFTPLGVWAMRRTRGSLADRWGVDALLLTTTGRRSGRARTVVLQFFPDGDDMILVAANDGGAADPAWYLNLREAPSATVEIRGRRTPVTAHLVPDDEATAWWARILEAAPDYARYARATTRRFPIVRLRTAGDTVDVEPASLPRSRLLPVAIAAGVLGVALLAVVVAAAVRTGRRQAVGRPPGPAEEPRLPAAMPLAAMPLAAMPRPTRRMLVLLAARIALMLLVRTARARRASDGRSPLRPAATPRRRAGS